MRGQRKNPRKAVQPFENKKRKIDIFKNYEANGVEKIQRKLEIFSTLISKKSRRNKVIKVPRVFNNSSGPVVEAISMSRPNFFLVRLFEEGACGSASVNTNSGIIES